MNNELFGYLVSGEELKEEHKIDGLSRYRFNLWEGKIFDEKQGKYLNPKPNARGYCYVNLQKDDKSRKVISVHKAIILASLNGEDFSKIFKGMRLVVDHINRNRSDNRSDNRWTNLNIKKQSDNLKGRTTKPVRLNQEQLKSLYNDFYLIDEAKHGEKHDVYNMLSSKYQCSSHFVQMKYLDFKKQKSA